MTELFFGSSAPVFKVGGDVKGELARDIIRLEIEESTAGLKTFIARFIAQGPIAGAEQEGILYLDGGIFDFGKSVEVSLGPGTEARTVFKGLVSGIEIFHREAMEPEVVVFAEDQLMKLRTIRRMKSYEKMTDAEIVESIAGAHGFAVKTDAAGPTYDVVQQWNVSDLAFMRERARLIQAEIWFEDDKLFFMTRQKRKGTELTLVQGNHLLRLQARADLAHQRTTIKVGGYDAGGREAIDEEAGAGSIEAEISRGASGPAVLERAFGARVSHRVKEVPLAAGEAASWARAEMLRRARSFVTIMGTTRGSPEMSVGSRLALERVGKPFDGPGYYVTRVCHSYDLKDGHRTHFDAERPTIQELS